MLSSVQVSRQVKFTSMFCLVTNNSICKHLDYTVDSCILKVCGLSYDLNVLVFSLKQKVSCNRFISERVLLLV